MDLAAGAKYPLRLIEADLQEPESWAKAVKSCSYVFHLASPFPDKSRREPPEEEVVRPAVDGTLSVLKACAKAGTVKRVILTSSIAAISCGTLGSPSKPAGYVYSESDWSDEAGCEVYEKSKLLAEKAAWDYVKTLGEDERFELVVLNPGYVQGPLLSASSGVASMATCIGLLTGKIAVTVGVSLPIVDVRDVVAAHIAALEKPEAAGNRYALVTGNITLKEIARMLADEFKPQGYTKIPSLHLPKALAWVGKFFDPTAKSIYPMIGKVVVFNNEKMVRELGIEPRPMRSTIIDTCYSLIELGVVRKTAQYLGHPSTRAPPLSKDNKPTAETTAEPSSGDLRSDGTSVEPEPTSSKQESEPKPASEPEPPMEESAPEPDPEPPQKESDSVPTTEEPTDLEPTAEGPTDSVPTTEEPTAQPQEQTAA